MKIAMFTNNYKPFVGGVPISIERLSKGLRELGHDVYIFAPSYDENLHGENEDYSENVIRYRSLKNKSLNGEMIIPNMFDSEIEKNFRDLEIDLIHVHHPMLVGNTAQYLSKKYDIPLVFTYHTRYEQYLHKIKAYEKLEKRQAKENNPLRKAEGKILEYTKESMVPGYIKLFSNSCDLVFAPTKLIKDYLEDKGVKSDIEVVPTGLEGSYFNENTEVVEEIRSTYKGDKEYLFCTVARITKEKNFDFLVNGLKELKDRIGNNFRLMVIGEGPYREEVEKLIVELDLEDNIVFLNNIDNKLISNYYRASDLFLFASKSETQGIVLLEAMAAKTPVIAVRASGVVEVLENGENGFMTYENTSTWAAKIEEVLNDDNLKKSLEENSYKTALRYMSSNVAKMAEVFYKNAIHRKKVKLRCKEIYGGYSNYMNLSTILKRVNLRG
ncbi:glycosyltransferase [Clostridium sp. B9]|uniref:glycosyltransferase n=1 Tax=Clostridium sp. B9 TaxID=3423224 RepID=UPI003D2F04F0